jgi:hypothetical protein
MDENKRKLIVIEKTQTELEQSTEEQVKPKVSRPNQTNPIDTPVLRNLAKFHNAKIGDKLTVKDLLR